MTQTACGRCNGTGLVTVDGFFKGTCPRCDGRGREPHEDGVYEEGGVWVTYVNGHLRASGPDRVIIEAGDEWHRSTDEFTQEF